MNTDPLEAVLFDCDGTLVDSESPSIRVLVNFVSEFGLQLDFEEALREFSGNELAEVLRGIEQKLGRSLPQDFEQQFRRRQIPILKEQLQAIDGAAELLNAMTLPACVASNAPLHKIQVCLEATGLDRHFAKSRIFSAYQIQTWKPAPDLFLMAAQSLGVAPARCAVVEDSRFGIDAGLAAGMQVFAFDPHGVHDHNPQVTSVRSLSRLIPIFCH
ncbi:MAG: HAD-IA family hydrolase [Fuerstiella sp.]|nr:HAD-IA family hydrolase [Fuerstiella sp.]